MRCQDTPTPRDSHGWEIHPNLNKNAGDKVVYKVQSNAFEETELKDVLTSLGVTKTIICGIWSEYCVANTAKAALSLGYQVSVVTDAHGTVAGTDDEAREVVAMQNEMLAKEGAQIVSVAEIANEASAK